MARKCAFFTENAALAFLKMICQHLYIVGFEIDLKFYPVFSCPARNILRKPGFGYLFLNLSLFSITNGWLHNPYILL